MMQPPLKTAGFLTLTFVLFLLIVEFTLTFFHQHVQANYLNLVPDHAWLAGNFPVNDSTNFAPLKAFSHPNKISFHTELSWFEELTGKFSETPTTMALSLHQTGKSQFELTHYLPLKKPYQASIDSIFNMLRVIENIEPEPPRPFHRHNIFSLKGQLFGKKYYFSVVKGLLVGSFSPVLVEDALLQSEKRSGYFSQNTFGLFSGKTPQPILRFYLHFSTLWEFLPKINSEWAAPWFARFFPEKPVGWEITSITPSTLQLTSRDFPSPDALLKGLPKEPVAEKKLLQYIPTDALAALHVGCANLPKFLQKGQVAFLPGDEQFAKWLFSHAGDETLLLFTVREATALPQHIQLFTVSPAFDTETFWKSAPPGEWMKQQSDLKIKQIQTEKATYFVASMPQLLCIAETQEAITGWYQRSFNAFQQASSLIEKLADDKKSLVTLAVQQEGLLPFLESQFKDNFLLALKQHYRQFRALEGGVYSVAWDEKTKNWQATLRIFTSTRRHGEQPGPQLLQTFYTPIASRAMAPTPEDLLVVRQGPILTKMNPNTGAIAWTSSLQGELKVVPVFLTTAHQPSLHIWSGIGNQLKLMNSQGQVLKNFPIFLPNAFQVSDLGEVYTTNRETNLLYAQNKDGHVYLVRPDGLFPGGWQPRNMGGSLVAPLVLHWEKDEPYYLAVTENGMVQACKTWGRAHTGFPLLLQTNLAKNIGYKEGGNVQNTQATVLSLNGELITFNLQGVIVKRKSLDRIASTRRFYLCTNSQNIGEWVIVRQDLQRLVIMDARGEPFFTIPWENKGGEFYLQYLPFTPLRKLMAVFDPEKTQFQLFEFNGDTVLDTPLKTTQPPVVQYLPDTQSYRLTYPVGKQLFVWDVES